MPLDLPDLAALSHTARLGLTVLDLVGVAAFSLSGALLAVSKRFDLFGVLVLGCVTAVGGGAIRDSLLGVNPPMFLRNEALLYLALGAALLAFVLGPRLSRWERQLSVFDTLGLAAFAVSGATGAVALGLGPLGVVFIGMLSGSGGGVIRDLLAHEVPQVLYRRDQLYATAAGGGALTVYLLSPHLGAVAVQLMGVLAVVLLRWVSRRGWVRLPVREME